jgi:hypothetical protein
MPDNNVETFHAEHTGWPMRLLWRFLPPLPEKMHMRTQSAERPQAGANFEGDKTSQLRIVGEVEES